MTTKNNMAKTAKGYRDLLGFPVIPQMNKKPLVKWAEFQKRLPNDEEINKWWADTPDAGLSAVTGTVSGIVVIDCDSQDAIDAIEDIIPDNMVVPCCSTPRGGRHYYFSSDKKVQSRGQKDFKYEIDLKAEGSLITLPPSQNGVGKYEWIIKPKSKADFPSFSNIDIYINKYLLRATDKTNCLQSLHLSTSVYKMFQEGSRDEDLFHIANQLKLARTPDHEIDQVINILGKNCNPPLTEKEINEKVLSAIKRYEHREKSLAQEIREWVCLQVGTFNLQTVYQCLQVSTRHDKKNISIILKRMSEEENNIIEKHGTVAGTYKTVDHNLKEIDLSDRTDLKGALPVKFPLGIEEFIRVMPSNVYIISGETDAGKSAFLMNFAKMNADEHKIRYFSSEMGKEEFIDRLDHLWQDAGHCDNFHFYEHYVDFEQVIFPDDINIIDYLQLYDNFYLMAQQIDKIAKKLNGGIVFIALQKPKGRDEGEGGERTKNLPRLYLSLSPGRIKIVKAKNWRNPKVNPNRLVREFKLVNGCDFIATTPWDKEEEETSKKGSNKWTI